MERIGREIKAKRKQLGLTQQEIAGDFMSISKLSNIENGKCVPDFETWNYLKEKLSLSDQLFIDQKEIAKVDFLLEQADTYNNTGLQEKAKEKYLEILNREDGEIFFKNQMAHAYKKIGIIELDNRNFETAQAYVQKAEMFYNDLRQMIDVAKTKVILGVIYYKKEKYLLAVEQFKAAFELIPETETELKGKIYYNMGSAYYLLHKYDDANYVCEQALSLLADETTDHYIAALILQGILYRENNFFLLAKDKLLKAKEVAARLNRTRFLAKCWHNLGDVELDCSNEEKALEYFRLAFDIQAQIGDEIGVIRSKISIASVHYKMNHFVQSKALCEESLRLSRVHRLQLEESRCLDLLSKVYLEIGDERKFLDTVFKAITLAENLKMASKKVALLELLAKYFHEKGDHKRCLEKLHEAFLIKHYPTK